MRPLLALGFLLAIARTSLLSSQEAQVLSRDLSELSSPDTLILHRGIRLLGHRERTEDLARILPLLTHPLPGIRSAAAQAAAQAVQGLQGDSSRGAPGVSAVAAALGERVAREEVPAVRGMLALSLGRLPYGSAAEISRAREWLRALGDGIAGAALVDVARGTETMARRTARRLPFSEALLSRLREWAGDERAEPLVRRHALGALLAAQSIDAATLTRAALHSDPLLRRLAMSAMTRLEDPAERNRLLHAGMTDSSALVRYEALRVWARNGAASCEVLLQGTRDPTPLVSLLAFDLVGTGCAGDSTAVRLLAAALPVTESGAWHRSAHALVSLARLAPGRAGRALSGAAAAPTWQLRMYAARAAGILRDTMTLARLARDPTPNVREAAIAGLNAVSGHRADPLYRAALGSPDYQLVLTAATALAGSPDREAAVHALLQALERITRERRETSRDPRLAILARLRELGTRALSARLMPYRDDFDPAVADSTAALLAFWTGDARPATPRPLPRVAASPEQLERLRGKLLRFTMASGGEFEVELLVDDAPLTVLRITRLAARGYYNGLTFHRVVPNFVLQGGSPGANEYAGDGHFMPDELGPRSHLRGSLGISTRGRHTGDAQLFLNLVDNPRLDYDYTVWGRVVSGMATVDAVLEGAVITRVEIRSR